MDSTEGMTYVPRRSWSKIDRSEAYTRAIYPGDLVRDQAPLGDVEEILLEDERGGGVLLHADLDRECVAGQDAVGDVLGVVEQELEGRQPPPSLVGHEPLTDDAFEGVAELQLDQVALDRVEGTDDPVDHLRRTSSPPV